MDDNAHFDAASLHWDSEDDEYDVFDSDLPLSNPDHTYAFPFAIGPYHINTLSYLMENEAAIQLELINQKGEFEGTSIWADLYPDLTDTNDPENMDAAARDASHAFPIAGTVMTCESLKSGSLGTALFDLSGLDSSYTNELADAVAELNLDDPRLYGKATYYNIKPSNRYDRLNKRYQPKIPPLSPVTPSTFPVILRFKAAEDHDETIPRILVGQFRRPWHETMCLHLESSEAPPAVDEFDDTSTKLSTANRRPPSESPVLLVWPDGFQMDIGVHAYGLDNDLDMNLNFQSIDLALQELFASPGGEGLTNPTPSHLLHQIACCLLSAALSHNHVVLVEQSNIDIQSDDCHIDVTSSASIWKKKLRPTRGDRDFKPRAAVSKYDIVGSLISSCSPPQKTFLLKAVANCLSCEYPGTWTTGVESQSKDLELQFKIYEQIASMPRETLDKLSEMCYSAALEAAIPDVASVKFSDQGDKYKMKADRLLQKVGRLRPKNLVAVPPLCTSEIIALEPGAFTVNIQGHDFEAGSYDFQGKTAGPRYSMIDCDSFLKTFPSDARTTYLDAKNVVLAYDDCYISAAGLSHEGPCSESEAPESELRVHVNHIYKHNAFSQLAEIRCDLVRSINALPFPAKGVWQQVYLYKGKVCAWYRSRDMPNSAEGYRIDWFAVSSFSVLGSASLKTSRGDNVYLWPRQRLRSQEMDLALMAPRRLKYVLMSMLEKARSTLATYEEIALAWNRLAATATTSTWASGELFKTCRYLSASLSSPSSPFDSMAEKLQHPHNFADVYYLVRLDKALRNWSTRDQYHSRCAILGLPRAYCQLESYWMLWVPDEYADTDKHLALCVMNLHTEYELAASTMNTRLADLMDQYRLILQFEIQLPELTRSLQRSCSLDTKGKLGWSWIGSLAAGHALKLRSDPSQFDAHYGRGTTHRSLVTHMTVRHSARITPSGFLEKGTVAEMMIASGTDPYLSIVESTYRFLFLHRPVFFNHPKKGEHKDREISITDPDSRIALNSAELICGHYGRTTRVDFLKEPKKDSIFYKVASQSLEGGGVIQSSDASRYGPMMSNLAIAIMLLGLSTGSTHLRWAAVVYARLAFRVMTLSHSIFPYLTRLEAFADTREKARQVRSWMTRMPTIYHDDRGPAGGYCTAMHMGQGMSHHSSSLLHAGGLLASQDTVLLGELVVNNKRIGIQLNTMVTSDDSTLLPMAHCLDEGNYINRKERQTACHMFLRLQRAARNVCLRMVSVIPNLPKEVIAGNKGEFNSQDTGLGHSCPILGFRESISLLVVPSSGSLIGDMLTSHANSKTVAFAGQGLSCANYFHAMTIDSVAQRWSLKDADYEILNGNLLVPNQLFTPATGEQLLSSPSSWLSPSARAFLLRESIEKNCESEDLDPHTRDSVFAPLMHIKVSMSKQHRKAISAIKSLAHDCKTRGYIHQARMLDEALSSTLSSARTRNLGRVGSRIKHRIIKPRDWKSEQFTKDTVFQHTLAWLAYMSNKYASSNVTADDVMLGNSVAGYIKLGDAQTYKYPHPPTRRIHRPDHLRKPRFREGNYGATPFGKHALERSRTVLVAKMGPEERRSIQEYIAKRRHRSFTEHITYGNVFVTSWHRATGQLVIALDLLQKIDDQLMEHVKWGAFDAKALSVLMNLQSANPGTPVLAIHRYSDGRGLWHAVHRGSPITVYRSLDTDELDTNFTRLLLDTGREVILALQGFADTYEWHGTGPDQQEIESYLESDLDKPVPAIIRSTEIENMRQAKTQLPTYSTEILTDTGPIFVYVAPETLGDCYSNPSLRPHASYMRSKVIADLALSAYWHSALRGVCFRAFLKGHWIGETVWTGAVIGWKMSSTNFPTYGTIALPTSNVQAVFCIGSLDDPELLSPYNPSLFGTGVRVISGSETLQYAATYRTTNTNIPLILASNSGFRHFNNSAGSGFLNLNYGNSPMSPYPLSSPEARSMLHDILFAPQAVDLGW